MTSRGNSVGEWALTPTRLSCPVEPFNTRRDVSIILRTTDIRLGTYFSQVDAMWCRFGCALHNQDRPGKFGILARHWSPTLWRWRGNQWGHGQGGRWGGREQ